MQTAADLPRPATIDHARVINVGRDGAGLGGFREAFLAAGYTVDGVADRLGPVAGAALRRHETVPARRATARGDALDLLLRLFPLQLPVDERAAAAVLPVEALLTAGFAERSGEELRAVLDVRPYREAGVGHGREGDGPPWWVVSDLGTGLDGRHRPLPGEHVLGVGTARRWWPRTCPRGRCASRR